MINGLAVTNSRAVQRVALWRLTTIRPEKRVCRAVPFEVDRFRQTLEQNFDVGPVRRINAGSDTERGAENSSFVSLRFAFLSPVEKTALGIHGDADAMPAPVIAILPGQAGLNVHREVRPVSTGAHHTHALAIAPVDSIVFNIALDLLSGDDLSNGHNHGPLGAVEVSPLNKTVDLKEVFAELGSCP